MAVNTPSAHIMPDAKKKTADRDFSKRDTRQHTSPVRIDTPNRSPDRHLHESGQTDPKPTRLMSGLPSVSLVLVSTTTQDCSPTPNEIATPDLSSPLQP